MSIAPTAPIAVSIAVRPMRKDDGRPGLECSVDDNGGYIHAARLQFLQHETPERVFANDPEHCDVHAQRREPARHDGR